MASTDLMRAALSHAARGWHVFPLRPNDKRPAIRDWETRATTDPARIRKAWTRGPFGIGIACGPSGLVVLDLDRPKPDTVRPAEWDQPGIQDGADVLAALADDHGEEPPLDTLAVQTGSVIHGWYGRSQPRQGRGSLGGPEFVVAGLSAGRQRRGAVAGRALARRLGCSR